MSIHNINPFLFGLYYNPFITYKCRLASQANAGSYPAQAKLKSILTNVLEELPDAPLYYSVHELSKTLKTNPPAQDLFRSALVNAGEPQCCVRWPCAWSASI